MEVILIVPGSNCPPNRGIKRQIVVFGGMIGKDFRKLVKFNLSVKGGGKEFVGLKGKEIGDKIKELEKRLYLGESYKNFTFAII